MDTKEEEETYLWERRRKIRKMRIMIAWFECLKWVMCAFAKQEVRVAGGFKQLQLFHAQLAAMAGVVSDVPIAEAALDWPLGKKCRNKAIIVCYLVLI